MSWWQEKNSSKIRIMFIKHKGKYKENCISLGFAVCEWKGLLIWKGILIYFWKSAHGLWSDGMIKEIECCPTLEPILV